jgi:hypothetical protein
MRAETVARRLLSFPPTACWRRRRVCCRRWCRGRRRRVKKTRQALPLAAATVRAVVGSVRLRVRTTRRRRRRQRLWPYVASTQSAAPAPVCGYHTAAAVAAVAGSVCRGRTCCGACLASTCWSARSARARGARWRRSMIRRRSHGCSGRAGCPRRDPIRRGAGHRRLRKGTLPTKATLRSDGVGRSCGRWAVAARKRCARAAGTRWNGAGWTGVRVGGRDALVGPGWSGTGAWTSYARGDASSVMCDQLGATRDQRGVG